MTNKLINTMIVAAIFILGLPLTTAAQRLVVAAHEGTTVGSTSMGDAYAVGVAFKLDRDVRLTGEVGQARNVMRNAARKSIEQQFEGESAAALAAAGISEVVDLHLLVPAFHATAGLRAYLPSKRRFRPFGEVEGGIMRIGPMKYVERLPTSGTKTTGTMTDPEGHPLNVHASRGIVRIGVGASAVLSRHVEVGGGYRYVHFENTTFVVGPISTIHAELGMVF